MNGSEPVAFTKSTLICSSFIYKLHCVLPETQKTASRTVCDPVECKKKKKAIFFLLNDIRFIMSPWNTAKTGRIFNIFCFFSPLSVETFLNINPVSTCGEEKSGTFLVLLSLFELLNNITIVLLFLTDGTLEGLCWRF